MGRRDALPYVGGGKNKWKEVEGCGRTWKLCFDKAEMRKAQKAKINEQKSRERSKIFVQIHAEGCR